MTSLYFLDRVAGRDPDIRAGDADRERVAERLRKSHAEGRLDLEEFQQRLERCYEAKTLGVLDELVADLPREEEMGRLRPFGAVPWWRWKVAPLVPILVALIVVSAAVGHHFFWLWIPLVFFFWRMSWWRFARERRGPHGWI